MKTPHCKKLAGLAAPFASLSLGTTAKVPPRAICPSR